MSTKEREGDKTMTTIHRQCESIYGDISVEMRNANKLKGDSKRDRSECNDEYKEEKLRGKIQGKGITQVSSRPASCLYSSCCNTQSLMRDS